MSLPSSQPSITPEFIDETIKAGIIQKHTELMLDAARSFATCPNCGHAAHDNPCPECGAQIPENGGLKTQLQLVKHKAMITHYLEVKFKKDIDEISFKNWSRDEVIDLFIDLVAGFERNLTEVKSERKSAHHLVAFEEIRKHMNHYLRDRGAMTQEVEDGFTAFREDRL